MSNSLNLRQLEVFHAIMSSGSLTEAARVLNVTQPSISAVLKHAEDRLGARLFERTGGRLVPTPEAEQLFPEVQHIFAQLQILQRVTSDVMKGRSGLLAVIGNPTLTNALLPSAVAKFRVERPEVRIRLETAFASQIVDRVARREFELGIIYGQTTDLDIGGTVIGHTEIACAMKPSHPLARRKVIHAKDLVDQDIITFGSGSPIRIEIDRTFREAKLDVNPSVEVSFSATGCLVARESTGVALIDPLIFRTGAFSDLVVRPLEPRRKIAIQLLFPKNRRRSQLSIAFESSLRQVMNEPKSLKADRS